MDDETHTTQAAAGPGQASDFALTRETASILGLISVFMLIPIWWVPLTVVPVAAMAVIIARYFPGGSAVLLLASTALLIASRI